jgi:concentrative nucleoside transporter, CNT family
MRKLFSMAAFVAVFFVLLTGCEQKKSSIDSQVVRGWETRQIQKEDGSQAKIVSKGDSLWIKSDGSFSYILQKENIEASGTWAIKDSVLALTYSLPDASNQVDSIQLSVKENKAELNLYSENGNLIGSVNNAGLDPIRKTRYYKIQVCSRDSLVFSENNITYTYQYFVAKRVSEFSMMGVMHGMGGILVLIGLAFVFSRNRKSINWKLVLTGCLLQISFGLLVMKVPGVRDAFNLASLFFVKILDFTYQGASFVFGSLVDPSKSQTFGFIFAFKVLPTIIFFSALTTGLYYLGVLQKVVWVIAWIMTKTMRLSGAESLSGAANIFLGQTEAPLLVKPYIAGMTFSELMCLMTGGMATIAGGVLAAYVGFLGGDDPVAQQEFATHLLTASIMNAPAAVVMSKILVPETQYELINQDLGINKEKIGSNLIDALSSGTIDGLKLAVNVGAMLIAFIAIIALCNYALEDIIGKLTGVNALIAESTNNKFSGLSLQYIFGSIFRFFAFAIGVEWQDSLIVGSLLGQKTILNEFVAYGSLANLEPGIISHKSIVISTYALCGFANISSIAIQIGGIGALAPNQKSNLSKLGFTALLGASLACMMSAAVAGMLY